MKLSINYTLETIAGDFDTLEVTANAELIKDPLATGDSPSRWDITDITLDDGKESFIDLGAYDQRKIESLLVDEARGYS
jgi:hypothetical protein